jgi:uncharacterized protein DUF4157
MIKRRSGDVGATDARGSRHAPPAIAPGKRTLTETLPAGTAGVVQCRALPDAATSTPGESRSPSPSRLLALFSPNLAGGGAPEQPVQREAVPPAASGSRALPDAVRGKMEGAFGSDFSGVRVHEGPQAEAMGALAYTQGAHIHFAPGAYDPDSRGGQELLGHELTHVVQQAQGRVAAGGQAKGAAVNSDAGLEREADELGARAARGQPAATGGGNPAISSGPGSVVQRKTGGELSGFFAGAEKQLSIETKDDYVTKCVAGYLAAKQSQEVSENTSPASILDGTDWKTVVIPDELCALFEKFPAHYLPTNVKVWKDLFDRIGAKRGKLSAPGPEDVDLSPQHPDSEVAEHRAKILGDAEKKVSTVSGGLTSDEQGLYDKILQAKITMNIPLDKLFDFRSPHVLNGFEVGEKYGKGSSNTQGGLQQERRDAEQKHLGIGQLAPGRVRPRYAALNFKGHPTGAAARNDYGLSYLVLSDALKKTCTITIGDSFNAPTKDDWGPAVKFGSAFPFSENGVKALVKTIFALQNMGNSDMDTITAGGDYHPSDNYLEIQIHDDVDMRSGVDEIWVSKLEMGMFAVPLETVTTLIETITGGAFELVD